MGHDYGVLVYKSRKQSQQYYRLYKEPILITQLVEKLSCKSLLNGGVSPFGDSLLVAGFDDSGPQLYQVDPSCSYLSWKTSRMGENVSHVKTFLEKRYTDDMKLEDAIHTTILTLKEGYFYFTYFCIFSLGKQLAFTWRVHLIFHMFTLCPHLYALSILYPFKQAALESDTRESVFLLAN
ncbi:hypothetical protein MKW92_004377 [Papaver armeniacum]|nr:hypothetical protein MKW92_004377 [Papaver armeniacum]